MSKQRPKRILSLSLVTATCTLETPFGPIRAIRIGTRWYFSAVDLCRCLGFTNPNRPVKALDELSDADLSCYFRFSGDERSTLVLSRPAVKRVLNKRHGISSLRRERAEALTRDWLPAMEAALRVPRGQQDEPAEQTAELSCEVPADLPEIALTRESIGGQCVPATTSLQVAEYFGKRHDHVIRDIRDTMEKCSEAFRLPNFGETSYTDDQGREYPMYLLSKNGFLMLAMSYVSPRAMLIKERYIAAFDAMAAQTQNPAGTMPTYQEALRGWANTLDALSEAEQRATRAEAERDFEREARIQEAPLVRYARASETNGGDMDVGTYAQLFRQKSGQPVGRNKMFEVLVRHGYLVRSVGAAPYRPAGEAAQNGWLRLAETHYEIDGRDVVYLQVMVTPAGLLHMTNKLLDELQSLGMFNVCFRPGAELQAGADQ